MLFPPKHCSRAMMAGAAPGERADPRNRVEPRFVNQLGGDGSAEPMACVQTMTAPVTFALRMPHCHDRYKSTPAGVIPAALHTIPRLILFYQIGVTKSTKISPPRAFLWRNFHLIYMMQK